MLWFNHLVVTDNVSVLLVIRKCRINLSCFCSTSAVHRLCYRVGGFHLYLIYFYLIMYAVTLQFYVNARYMLRTCNMADNGSITVLYTFIKKKHAQSSCLIVVDNVDALADEDQELESSAESLAKPIEDIYEDKVEEDKPNAKQRKDPVRGGGDHVKMIEIWISNKL